MSLFRKVLRVSGFAAAIALVAGVGLAYADVNVDAENNTTGANSENITRILSNRSWIIDLEDNLRLDNRISAWLNTGENDIDRNTTVGWGDPSTGDINVSADIMNPSVNDSFFDFNLGSWNEDIDVSGSNELTGANSRNINIVRANRTLRFDIENNARIDNDINLRLNTGENTTERNTTVGDVSTGNIDTSISIDNSSASNPLAMLSGIDLGGSNGISADFQNDTTGFNSVNRNTLEANSRINVNLENNARISNDLDICANTGRNDISENTTVGNVSTGDITVDLSISN